MMLTLLPLYVCNLDILPMVSKNKSAGFVSHTILYLSGALSFSNGWRYNVFRYPYESIFGYSVYDPNCSRNSSSFLDCSFSSNATSFSTDCNYGTSVICLNGTAICVAHDRLTLGYKRIQNRGRLFEGIT